MAEIPLKTASLAVIFARAVKPDGEPLKANAERLNFVKKCQAAGLFDTTAKLEDMNNIVDFGARTAKKAGSLFQYLQHVQTLIKYTVSLGTNTLNG